MIQQRALNTHIEREMRIQYACNHPSILKLYGVSKAPDGRIVFIIEPREVHDHPRTGGWIALHPQARLHSPRFEGRAAHFRIICRPRTFWSRTIISRSETSDSLVLWIHWKTSPLLLSERPLCDLHGGLWRVVSLPSWLRDSQRQTRWTFILSVRCWTRSCRTESTIGIWM